MRLTDNLTKCKNSKMKTTKTPTPTTENLTAYEPPQEEINALARLLFPAIREYYESEQGKQDFENWINSENA